MRGVFDTQISYVEVERHDDSTDTFRLMRADADGARPVLLLESSEPILSPVWSPDGRQVAYVSFETTRPAVFVQNLATGEREQEIGRAACRGRGGRAGRAAARREKERRERT